MTVKLGNNIASLRAVRALEQTTLRLSSVFERLSSGQRINSAADDAAGLAMSTALRADSKLFARAVQNVNDGVSLLSVEESALETLSSILARQRELATQAANGSFTFAQRSAMNDEFNTLVNEYNRIVRGLEYNGSKLLNNIGTSTSLQVGIEGASDNVISFTLGEDLARTVGDGTFQSGVGFTPNNEAYSVTTGDFNGDGILDVVVGENVFFELFLGNGDGTFQTGLTTALPSAGAALSVQSADLNGDGILDVIVGEETTDELTTYLGNGNGTFASGVQATILTEIQQLRLEDFNGDGNLDIAFTSAGGDDTVGVVLGNGDGTFTSSVAYGSVGDPDGIAVGDVNGDGFIDIVTGNDAGQRLGLLLGNGDGTFVDSGSFGGTQAISDVELADLNLDGYLDIIAPSQDGESLGVLLGNGDGTFGDTTSFYVGDDDPLGLVVADLNGDGYLDAATANVDGSSNSISVLLGQGDGTFSTAITYGSTSRADDIVAGDFNGDGGVDLVAVGRDPAGSFYEANITQTATLALKSLYSTEAALEAATAIDEAITRVSAELGALGGLQSRLQSTLNVLASAKENFDVANARILDADIAKEAADLVRLQILQQAGAAVLAQANQQPSLVLSLISGSTA